MDRSKEGERMDASKDKLDEQYQKKLKLVNAYNKEHYKALTIRLDRVKDLDIIEWLENFESPKRYICDCIRRDINKL